MEFVIFGKTRRQVPTSTISTFNLLPCFDLWKFPTWATMIL